MSRAAVVWNGDLMSGKGKDGCPISQALKDNVQLSVKATLLP